MLKTAGSLLPDNSGANYGKFGGINTAYLNIHQSDISDPKYPKRGYLESVNKELLKYMAR